MPDSTPYETYEISDFLLDDAFVEWVQTGSDSGFWNEFLLGYPDKFETIEQARSIILAGELIPVRYPSENQIALMWSAVEEVVNSTGYTIFNVARSSIWWSAAAAVLIVVGGWLWFGVHSASDNTYENLVAQVKDPMREIVNQNMRPMLVELPDGSTVELQPRGRLSYPAVFAPAARHVYLSGEGFFQVVKDPAKPFFVHANELVTKVLGTSFTIKTNDKLNSATVAVRTGKVSVFTEDVIRKTPNITNREVEGVVLTPNQKLTFDSKQIRMIKSLVAEPILVDSTLDAGSFIFNNVPMQTVFKTFEDAYGVDIVFDEELMRNCRLSAELPNEPLFEKLRLICKTLGGSYSIIDAQIVIQSAGCDL